MVAAGPDNEALATVMDVLKSPDEVARSEFFRHFRAQSDEFATHTAEALQQWVHYHSMLYEGRAWYVAMMLYTAINQNLSSYKLFMSGHTVAAGCQFRQVLEAIAMAVLCSSDELEVFERFEADKYSTNDAVRDLGRHGVKLGMNRDALTVLLQSYKFYHDYSHISKLTIAAGANLGEGSVPHLGAFFDEGKLQQYTSEVNSRVSLTRQLPNLVHFVAGNALSQK